MACWIFKKFGSVTIILYLWAQMNFYPYCPHLTNLGEIWYSDSRTLLEGHKWMFAYILYILTWPGKHAVQDISTEMYHVTASLMKITTRKSYFIYGNKWISIHNFHIYCLMGEIQYKTFTHNAAEHYGVSQKLRQIKPYFSYKHKQKFTTWQPVLWKSPPGNPTLLRGINEFLSIISTFIVWWVKSSIRHSHTMLLSISEFNKNWDRESPTFLTGINKIIFMCINHTTFGK